MTENAPENAYIPFRRGKTDTTGMTYPGRCRWCGSIYDGATVTVTARYSDCSVWKAPCCGATADDRPLSWGGSFTPLTREERRDA